MIFLKKMKNYLIMNLLIQIMIIIINHVINMISFFLSSNYVNLIDEEAN